MLHTLCNVSSGRLSRVEPDEELTVDQLAAKVGMTVRNVRAYAGRGLIPPPRLAGRTGYYGQDHVARLTLVQELLGKGYTLAAVERMMSELPDGAMALGVFETLVNPWTPSEPEELDELQLAERAGIPHDPAIIAKLVELGIAERLDNDRLRIPNPDLLRTGLEVIKLGVPLDAIFAMLPKLFAQADAVAKTYVELFRSTVWRQFADAGLPADGWPEIQRTLENIIPLAGQALVAAFREAMAREIEIVAYEELGLDPTTLPSTG
ncbi:MerR family transcriptional regulator [Kribbella sandramycini]|uniref:MerR family transcriptional regulator n=1 Tax=Kribbella sandramycini TaxID=60450 RepID=A0A7Y4NXZ9_9ACTN|nr:MerR family transcriptional regulator [Kribbella sandramycini]NOL40011.1 MerR family transcriptional regulator [Kribbella sandramycini]